MPEKLTFGGGWFGHAILAMAAMQYLAFYYNQVMGLPLVKVSFAILCGRLIDAFSDPLMGWISDSTGFRFGRRKPYILIGGCLWALTVFYLINPPAAVRASESSLLLFLAFMMVAETTVLTMLLVPLAALGVDITPNAEERVNLAAIRNWFFHGGKVVALLIIRPLIKTERFGTDYAPTILYFTLFAALMIAVAAFACKERVSAPPPRRKVSRLESLRLVGSNKPFIVLC
ncbi:MFS transporter, partial [Candidatus Hydrogenedentota bacterium]